MLLPFSARGKVWEPKAAGLRKLAGVGSNELLDPWLLAPKIGLRVVAATTEILNQLGDGQGVHLRGNGGRCWSGGVYPIPFPDGTHLCILNPTHSHRRNKITLMEEICHMHLRHRPCNLILRGDALEVRDYDHDQEHEAYGVGAAALLPWHSFFAALNSGGTADDLAGTYDVTAQLIEYRIKVSGASRLYQARQRNRVTSTSKA